MDQVEVERVMKDLDIAFTIDLKESVVFTNGGTSNPDELSKAIKAKGYKIECHHDGTMVVTK